MNKSDVIKVISDKTNITEADCRRVSEAFIETIAEALKAGDTVTFAGFGHFRAKQRAAKEGLHPKTGERIKIDGRCVPTFKASKTFVGVMNKK